MPNLKTHNRFNAWFMLPLCLLGFYHYLSDSVQYLLVFSLSFLYATYYASPDMDLAGQIKLLSFRGLLTFPFRLFYAPISKHRGLSHSIIFGTLSRLLTLCIFAATAIFFFKALQIMSVTGFISTDHLQGIVHSLYQSITLSLLSLGSLSLHSKMMLSYFLIGFLAADLSHIGLDQANTQFKRLIR